MVSLLVVLVVCINVGSLVDRLTAVCIYAYISTCIYVCTLHVYLEYRADPGSGGLAAARQPGLRICSALLWIYIYLGTLCMCVCMIGTPWATGLILILILVLFLLFSGLYYMYLHVGSNEQQTWAYLYMYRYVLITSV